MTHTHAGRARNQSTHQRVAHGLQRGWLTRKWPLHPALLERQQINPALEVTCGAAAVRRPLDDLNGTRRVPELSPDRLGFHLCARHLL